MRKLSHSFIDSIRDKLDNYREVVQFSAEGHVYKVNGEVVPSVSDLLSQFSSFYYSRVPRELMDRKASDGHMVHALSAMADFRIKKGATAETIAREVIEEFGSIVEGEDPFKELSRFNIDPFPIPKTLSKDGFYAYLGHLVAYVKFVKRFSPTWLDIECRLWNEQYGYAGTSDRVGILVDKETNTEQFVILDIKTTSKVSPLANLQLAGYAMTLVDQPSDCSCYVLQLMKDGKYVFYSMEVGRDEFQVFSGIAVFATKYVPVLAKTDGQAFTSKL